MLALPLSDPELKENGFKVYRGFTLHDDYKRTIDAAGHRFEEWYREMILGHKKEEKVEEEEEQKNEFNEDDVKNFEKKRHKKDPKDLLKGELEDNHYNILGLEELGMGASEGQIKTAYRKLALIHHPDKSNDGKTTPLWLKIQSAYETLIDPEKKKKYDSTLPFEDTIPEETVDEKDFFDVFKPVFIRNAFWSNKKPIPDIGDMNTDIKKVERFYAFWDNFDSWRDFSVYDEYNLDEAENRYERRYMEKENKKIKATHLKQERQRIMKLVENARNSDPRLIKIRKEQEEARLKAKLEKQQKKDQYKKEREDEEKRREEAKLAKIREKEEEEKRVIEEKKRKENEVRKAIRDLKAVFAEKIDSAEYDKFWLESFMDKLKHEDNVALGAALTNTPKEKAMDELLVWIRKFDKTLEKRSKELIQKDKELEKQRKEEEKKRKEADWSVEELSLLAKGLTKFPSGTKNRWGCVASFLGTKTADEVLQKSKELAQTANNKATTERLNKEAFDQVKKQGMKVIDAAPDTRAVFDQTKFGSKEIPVKEEKKTADKPAEKKPNGEATPTAAPKAEEWTQEEQKKLELALREFPATLEAQERWTKIAEKVGKTKKQCIDRFKELREAIKKAQEAKK